MPATVICYDVLGSDALEVTLFADGSDTPIDAGDFTRRTNDAIAGTFSATGLSGLHRIVLKTAAGAERWTGWVVLASSGTLEAQDSPHAARMATMVAPDGAIWKFSANALEESPSGGGGGDCPTAEEIADVVAPAVVDAINAAGAIEGDASCPCSDPGGILTVVAGDDYHAADGRPLTVTIRNWPDDADVTGAILALKRGEVVVYSTEHASSLVGTTMTMRFDVDGAITDDLPPGPGEWGVDVTLSTDHQWEPVTGVLHVKERVGART